MTRAGAVELHLHPRDPRGRIRSLRLTPRGIRLAGGVFAAYLAFLVGGLAVAPRTITNQLLQHDYRVRLARRQQLGERVQALVDRFGELAKQGHSLSSRVQRIARIYGLPEAPAGLLSSQGAPNPARSPTSIAPREAASTIFGGVLAQGNRLEAGLRRDLDRIDLTLAALSTFESENPRWVAAVPSRSPLRGKDVVLTSGFGTRRSPYTRVLEFHAGIDLAAPAGTRVFAPAAGVVVWAGAVEADRRNDWWRLGLTVVLDNGDNFKTIFGHCQETLVRPGMRVAAGDPIATVGETGWTTAPHLHYEIRRRLGADWLAIEPRDYLLDRPLDDPEPQSTPRPPGALGPQPLPPQFLH
ncbi:MAG: M23 family metallopeptidase [Thermoanaerobaculia bacterium]